MKQPESPPSKSNQAFAPYLIIQREAVGFTDDRDMDRLYRILDPFPSPKGDWGSYAS